MCLEILHFNEREVNDKCEKSHVSFVGWPTLHDTPRFPEVQPLEDVSWLSWVFFFGWAVLPFIYIQDFLQCEKSFLYLCRFLVDTSSHSLRLYYFTSTLWVAAQTL